MSGAIVSRVKSSRNVRTSMWVTSCERAELGRWTCIDGSSSPPQQMSSAWSVSGIIYCSSLHARWYKLKVAQELQKDFTSHVKPHIFKLATTVIRLYVICYICIRGLTNNLCLGVISSVLSIIRWYRVKQHNTQWSLHWKFSKCINQQHGIQNLLEIPAFHDLAFRCLTISFTHFLIPPLIVRVSSWLRPVTPLPCPCDHCLSICCNFK